MEELKILQGKLESLKHLMEQYFMGVEKRMPAATGSNCEEVMEFSRPTILLSALNIGDATNDDAGALLAADD